jgi:3-methyladenine DNA glycosylase AlkD
LSQQEPAEALLTELRRRLAAVADPGRADHMRAYMKSAMPFRGVSAEPLRRICREVFAEHGLPDRGSWEHAVRLLWDTAAYREERYAAIALCEQRPYRGYQDLATLELYHHLVVTGAWWDLVDGIAAHLVGALLREHPAKMKPRMRRWAKDRDMWKRRTAILSQLSFMQDTDTALLYACIEPSLDSPEFFLRKAIGWALRQYAWTEPGAVKRYVREHQSRLSPLSRREALKNLS